MTKISTYSFEILPNDLISMVSTYQSKEDAVHTGLGSNKRIYEVVKKQIVKRAAEENVLLFENIPKKLKCLPHLVTVDLIPTMADKTEEISGMIKKLLKNFTICQSLSADEKDMSVTDMLQLQVIMNGYAAAMNTPIIDFRGLRI